MSTIFEKRNLLIIVLDVHICQGNADTGWFLTGCPHRSLQLVGVADPSMKEPVRVAVTASAIIVQSSTQDEASDVVHNGRVANV